MFSVREYIPYYKRNLRVAGPVMLTQLGAAIAGIVDSVMVGHYGTTELAAVSLANSIFFTVMVFAMGAVMGVTPLVGYAFVQKRTERVAELLRSGLLFTLLLSALMMAVLFSFRWIMPLMGQDAAVVDTAQPYLLLVVVSVLPFLLFQLEKQFLEGLGNTMAAMITVVVLNLINIPLNWIFIFGHLGAPAMGATGAGLATLIVRVLHPLVLYVIIRKVPEWRQYLQNARTSWHTAAEIAQVGVPIGFQQMMEIFAFTFSVVLMGWISKEAVAAHQIANQVANITFMVSTGIGAATTIRVSHQYGAGKIYEMRMAAKASLHLALLWSFIGVTTIISCSSLIPLAFTKDAAVLALATPMLMLAGLFQVSDAMQTIGGAMLRGIADVRVPMCIAFVAYIVIAVPLGYILMFPAGMGPNGMWVAFIVGLSLAAILLHWRFWRIAPKGKNKGVS